MGITLKDIAAMAGVHKSTVDKVIHNRPGVSDAKRQEIRRLLEEYNYESNPLAKALNYQKNKGLIAVVLPVVDALPELKEGVELVRQMDLPMFKTVIRRTEKMPESTFASQPIVCYSPGSAAARDYRRWVREYLGEEPGHEESV